MTKKYEVGDKLRYIGECDRYFTNGNMYEIIRIGTTGFDVNDDEGEECGWGFNSIGVEFELVTEPSEDNPVEASPTVIELLANISRRLHEAERQLKSQAYEINELYKASAEGTVADRG